MAKFPAFFPDSRNRHRRAVRRRLAHPPSSPSVSGRLGDELSGSDPIYVRPDDDPVDRGFLERLVCREASEVSEKYRRRTESRAHRRQ
jgi:hypothetical protein